MIEIKDYALPSPDQWRMVTKGMRNAYKSWDKSDSYHVVTNTYFDNNGHGFFLEDLEEGLYEDETIEYITDQVSFGYDESFLLGKADKNLLLNLSKLGSSDRKVLRQLPITLEIKAPLKWWDQMDQYKIGTVTNSTSQMHCLMKKPFTMDDFSFDETVVAGPEVLDQVREYIDMLNMLRSCYMDKASSEHGKKHCWRVLLECLPQSYYYTRTWTGSYENIINIILQRYNHKLNEWRVFCRYCLDCIPMVREIIEMINPEIIEIYYGEESC